jgi:hypothetical protein
MSTKNTTTLGTRGDEIVNNIQQMQKTESSLFDQLKEGASSQTMSDTEMNDIVASIENISDMRTNLYAELQTNQKYYQQNVENSQDILTQETDALEIVERELHRAKSRAGLIREQKSNRLRLVEINRYYGDKYKHHTKILQYVTALFASLLAVYYLYNLGMVKRFVPRGIYLTLLIGVSCVGVYYIIKEAWDAYTRDNMIYQRYNWDKLRGRPDDDIATTDGNVNPWAASAAKPDECVGQECCLPEHTWVSGTINKCYPNTELDSTAITTVFPDGVAAYGS